VRFVERVAALPRLGIGISTEFGASRTGVHPVRLREQHPGVVDFLEIGADLARGLDQDAQEWVRRGWPTTYHFLDVNLEEPEDLDEAWVRSTERAARAANAAWMCGDAGLWHIGPRDRGHGTLLPPILCASSAHAMARSVRELRERTGFEVLPENPPAHVLVGDLHPLEYYGSVAERADCGLLLDLSHLAIVQVALGLPLQTCLELFPVERVVEMHVAGGARFRSGPWELVDDEHGPEVLDEVWALLELVLPRATALRAVVVECERNRVEEILPLMARVREAVRRAPGWEGAPALPPVPPALPEDHIDHRRLQRTLFRMLLDPAFARRQLGEDSAHPWLSQLHPDRLAADPQGRRAGQLLGNVALEFVHTVAMAPPFLEGFVQSAEFHEAIERDLPLPLAFARHARRVLPRGPWSALLSLETAMAELRRADGPSAPAPAGTVRLAPAARLLQLPSGTVAAAEALAAGRAPGRIGPESEFVALVGEGSPSPERSVRVEVLPDAIAELLRSLPADQARLAAFAARHEAELSEVLSLVDELARDGVLISS
jgi:uncharacterized protein (UPF0276 family)